MRPADDVVEFLEDTPGPSPWYLASIGPSFLGKKIEWLDDGGYVRKFKDKICNGNLVGKTFLCINDELKMILDFHCYVKKVHPFSLLVWYEQKAMDGPQGKILIQLFEIDKLGVLGPHNVNLNVHAPSPLYYLAHPVSLEIDNIIPQGITTILVPAALKELGELLLLAQSSTNELIAKDSKKTNLALYEIDLRNARVEKTLQDWFNEGPYDLMHQIPARLKRAGSGRIYGDGIRIRPFRLDTSKRNVDQWYGS